mmetsp:Transcript_7819/g.32640  ORF Transcript_7819/g.32640 Transcript_7819/m.32640 type:complete len:325 (-) Transcript_7819:3153-4127(-)
MSAAALAPLSVSRTARTTTWPFAAISRALMNPKPVFAPVITHTFCVPDAGEVSAAADAASARRDRQCRRPRDSAARDSGATHAARAEASAAQDIVANGTAGGETDTRVSARGEGVGAGGTARDGTQSGGLAPAATCPRNEKRTFRSFRQFSFSRKRTLSFSSELLSLPLARPPAHPRPRALHHFLAPRDDRARVPVRGLRRGRHRGDVLGGERRVQAERRGQYSVSELRGEIRTEPLERESLKRHRLAHRGGARGVAHVQVPAEHGSDAALVYDNVGRELAKAGDALGAHALSRVGKPSLRDFEKRLQSGFSRNRARMRGGPKR